MNNRALPRQLGCSLVVTRGGIVVEAVLDARIDKALIVDLGRLQAFLILRPGGHQAFILAGMMHEQAGLDLRHIF